MVVVIKCSGSVDKVAMRMVVGDRRWQSKDSGMSGGNKEVERPAVRVIEIHRRRLFFMTQLVDVAVDER